MSPAAAEPSEDSFRKMFEFLQKPLGVKAVAFDYRDVPKEDLRAIAGCFFDDPEDDQKEDVCCEDC